MNTNSKKNSTIHRKPLTSQPKPLKRSKSTEFLVPKKPVKKSRL